MKDKTPTPSPTGGPIVLRINLHFHDLPEILDRPPASHDRARNPGVAVPSPHLPKTPVSPARHEGALDRNRLADLIAAGSPPSAAPASEPDIEVTLVLHV